MPFTFATKTPTDAGIALTFSRKRGPWSLFSAHRGCFAFRFRRQKNSSAQISARPATPPTTPPTMLPMLASPLEGIVSPASESEPPCSGPMMPAAASPVGEEDRAVVVGNGCSSLGAFAVVGSGDVPAWLGSLVSTASEVWSTADSAAPGAVIKGAGTEVASGDGGSAAVDNVSELVVDATSGAASAPPTGSEGTTAATGLLTATGRCGTATAC